MLLEFAVLLGLAILVVAGVSVALMNSLFFFQSLVDADLYANVAPQDQMVFQRVLAPASRFEVYPDYSFAASNASYALSSSGSAVRLVYPDGRIAALHFDPSERTVWYQNVQPSTSRWPAMRNVDNAVFTIGDPLATPPITAGLVALTIEKQGHTFRFYAQPQ